MIDAARIRKSNAKQPEGDVDEGTTEIRRENLRNLSAVVMVIAIVHKERRPEAWSAVGVAPESNALAIAMRVGLGYPTWPGTPRPHFPHGPRRR